ncbi:hypothetical protein NDU88_006285 [Pleurodeles waltl]|uniref:Uncharacterized protein n=1 Tax=Pleurodeles waltl TaxID=8319 RepID=A0AAV7NT02_PLEWA|nr:hypothetical protein NDU88_006285 [Pleurodeles waltl]
MESSKVVQALKVLQEAGREDLIREGVLEQAWEGLKRPKRSSAERVSAAVLACTSSEASPKRFKKFKSKSVSGRKVLVSPERVDAVVQGEVDLPVVSVARGSGARFPRRAYRPGCEAAHVSDGHGSTSAHQRLGRPAGGQVPVEVGAPPGHRMEERVQSGAVRLTTRESAIRGGGSSDPNLSVHETVPDSRSTIYGLVAEEELDYEEDSTVSGEQAVAVQQSTPRGRAVQGDRLSNR